MKQIKRLERDITIQHGEYHTEYGKQYTNRYFDVPLTKLYSVLPRKSFGIVLRFSL